MKGEISDGQRPQLMEMLVVVANALPDPQQRMAFIQELVADSEAYWENPSTTQVRACRMSGRRKIARMTR